MDMTTTTDPRSLALATLVDLLGLPYLWPCQENGYKGKDPADGGLDCSGAVNWARYKAGVTPAVEKIDADELYRKLDKVEAKDAQMGDLCFYGTEEHVTHVMMVVGDGRVIGESGGGSRCRTVEISKSVGACMKYRGPGYRSDVVGYGRLV